MSATRDLAGVLARENGGALVFAALCMPVLLLFLSFTVDIGNWWVHKRHLQLQVDAAALAGGALLGGCFSDPAATNTAIPNEATRFSGGPGSTYNNQVGGSIKGTVSVRYQSKTYQAGSVAPDDTVEQPPCDTPNLSFDVKATEAGLPLLFQFPGLPNVSAINAHARVELRLVEIQDGMLPVAVPDLRFTYVFATFINEVNGAALGSVELQRNGTSGNDQLWSTPAGIPIAIPSQHVGVRIRLVGGTDPNAACGQLYTECYDLESTNGVVHIRGWSSGPGPNARDAWLLPGSCLPDAYFTTGDCSGGIQAAVDLGSFYPLTGSGVTADVWASVGGNGHVSLTPGGSGGLVTWTALGGLAFAGAGPHTVELNWNWEKTSGTWTTPAGRVETCRTGGGNKCKDSGTFGPIQRSFRSGGRSGPLRRVQVFESGVTSAGSNSFQIGSTPNLGLSIAVTGSLKVQSAASDPVVELRVVGSQNQTVDCDPATSNLEDELALGCEPAYKINPSLACPGYNVLWGLPEPWLCVKTQTGGSVGQVKHGMNRRILNDRNGGTCTAPINWPTYQLTDPRIVPLIITPFGSFSGTGNDIVPVIDFAAFYVVGWEDDPCPGAVPVEKGFIAGHFVKYAIPNPHGGGQNVCNRDALTPCVPVLTR